MTEKTVILSVTLQLKQSNNAHETNPSKWNMESEITAGASHAHFNEAYRMPRQFNSPLCKTLAGPTAPRRSTKQLLFHSSNEILKGSGKRIQDLQHLIRNKTGWIKLKLFLTSFSGHHQIEYMSVLSWGWKRIL